MKSLSDTDISQKKTNRLWIVFLLTTVAAVVLYLRLHIAYMDVLKFESDWASFYCAEKEVEYVGNIRPNLTMDTEKGHITRVSVICQGDIKEK